MRRSKLQLYLDTLEALVFCGPMKLTRITYKAHLNYGSLKKILKDLVKNKLVEEREMKNAIFYAATPKARTTLAKFRELNRILPFTDAAEVPTIFY